MNKLPYINGVCFVDTHGMDEGVVSELMFAGMVFLTTIKHDGKYYSGEIIARDFEHAEARAKERPFDETLEGRLEVRVNVGRP